MFWRRWKTFFPRFTFYIYLCILIGEGGSGGALATAVGTARDAAPSGSVALTLGGSLTAETAGKVGTVTVSVSKQ